MEQRETEREKKEERLRGVLVERRDLFCGEDGNLNKQIRGVLQIDSGN